MVSKSELKKWKDIAVNTEKVIDNLILAYPKSFKNDHNLTQKEWVTKKLVSQYHITKNWATELYLEFR